MPIKDSLDNEQLRRVWPFGCLINEPENKTLVAALRQGQRLEGMVGMSVHRALGIGAHVNLQMGGRSSSNCPV